MHLLYHSGWKGGSDSSWGTPLISKSCMGWEKMIDYSCLYRLYIHVHAVYVKMQDVYIRIHMVLYVMYVCIFLWYIV